MATSRASLFTLLLTVGGVLLTITVCGFFSVILYGIRTGREFSPDTFETREFSFYELPLWERQVTSNRRMMVANSLVAHLKANKLITVGKPARWDLVAESPAQQNEAAYDALLLSQFLNTRDNNGNLVWELWSTEHPKMAAVLWPEVQSLAQENLYVAIPELFEAAQHSSDQADLQSAIDDILSAKYREVGKWQIAIGNTQKGARLLKKAIAHGDDSKETSRLFEQHGAVESPQG